MKLFIVASLLALVSIPSIINAGTVSHEKIEELEKRSSFKYLGSLKNPVYDSQGRQVLTKESLYFLSPGGDRWENARIDCGELLDPKADLLCIETEHEYRNLPDALEPVPVGTAWTGGGYESFTKHDFVWMPCDNAPFRAWTNSTWSPGHPSHKLSQTRVYLNFPPGYKLQTGLSSDNHHFICEINLGDDVEIPIPCYQDNDLVIITDSSWSIGSSNYEIVKEFAARLALAWNAHIGNRVAVVDFGNDVYPVKLMSELLSDDELRTRILNSPYTAGHTRTHLALIWATSEITFNPRPNVPRNIVLMTDGVSDYPADTIVAAQAAHAAGIRTFCVGMTDDINYDELLAITGNRTEYVFTESQFDRLLELLKPVSEGVCEP